MRNFETMYNSIILNATPFLVSHIWIEPGRKLIITHWIYGSIQRLAGQIRYTHKCWALHTEYHFHWPQWNRLSRILFPFYARIHQPNIHTLSRWKQTAAKCRLLIYFCTFGENGKCEHLTVYISF